MALSFMVVGALCGLIALHPFTTYPVSLWLLKRWRYVPLPPRPAAIERAGDIAICMCAYNEERVIEAKIANLMTLKRAYPGLEILVYVDAATDRTAELLRAWQDDIRLVVSAERLGKTHGMNRLVSMATRPIILFTDANVMIDLDAPARLLRYFADPAIGCVSGHLRYTNPEASVTASTGSLYWRLEEWTKRLETDTGSAVGADGSLFAIRRELHCPPPDDIIDDMYVSMMVFCKGHRVVQADDVNAREESVTVSHEEFHRKIRIGCCAFNVHRVLWPRMRELSVLSRYKYVSHKWIRWLTIYFLVAAVLLFEIGLSLAGHGAPAAWLAGLAAAALLIGATTSHGPLAQAWDILSAFAATGLGVLRSVRGERIRTWTPAGSIRK
jgi:cellulose synthase/poly-beta-1,6-N-acetylglucosamine synthase-like glycosyltransferase